MKKILIVVILLVSLPILIQAESSECYVVMDANTNRVLDGKNINKEKLIASTSKIMTAIIVIENYNLNQEVTVDNSILKSYGSSMYLNPGEKLKIIDLLYGLLLRSGNDAAMVLANLAGSMDNFSKIMNQYAHKIGMKHTNFINSSGLENQAGIGNTSTAYDMGLLMSYAIKNPIFLKISGAKHYEFKSDKKTYQLKNKNKLLFMDERVIGGKTGYTIKAKRTLVTAAQSGSKKIIIVTLNDGNDFNDHLFFYNKVFKTYNVENICDNIPKISDPLNLYNGFSFEYNEDCNILLSKAELKRINVNSILFNGVNKKRGATVGVINFELDKEIIYQSQIRLGSKKNIFNIIKGWLYG